MMNIDGFKEVKTGSHPQQEIYASGKSVVKRVLAVLSKPMQIAFQ